jgi:hypothetical protein
MKQNSGPVTGISFAFRLTEIKYSVGWFGAFLIKIVLGASNEESLATILRFERR